MAFFIQQAIDGGTIDRKTRMSEKELENAVIARFLESNEVEKHMQMHRKRHEDAWISTIADHGGFSPMEKSVGKIREDKPDIAYDSNNKTFTVQCCCKKEKFIFNMATDEVRAEHTFVIGTKEIAPYRKNDTSDGSVSYTTNTTAGYGPNQFYSSSNAPYSGSRPSSAYSNGPDVYNKGR